MMKRKLTPPLLLAPLKALQKLMKFSKCPWAVIGGIAVSLLSKPRFTADIDVVILTDFEKIPQILKRAKTLGIIPRISNPIDFAKKNRVLLLKHFKSGINIDLSLGLLPFEKEAIRKSKRYEIGGAILYLPTMEDLIIFKSVAHRPQDILDIQEIINLCPKLDKKYLRKSLLEFSQILGIPEIWTDVEALLRKSAI